MGDKSSIEWTDATWNPTVGCSIVSPGCTNCYAMKMAHRFPGAKFRGLTVKSNGGPVWNGVTRLDEEALPVPLKWKRGRRIFVNSMSDLFHESLPDEAIDKVFAVMALAPQHVFQILTKRAARMRGYIAQDRMGYVEGIAKRMLRERAGDPLKPVLVGKTLAGTWPWPHVWLGVSVERQQEADERIPLLLETPAAVRFLSCEPLLGPIRLNPYAEIHWCIVGGESGPGARPFDIAWARSLRDQCKSAGVACFIKQFGADPFQVIVEGERDWLRYRDRKGGDWLEWPEDLRVREFPS